MTVSISPTISGADSTPIVSQQNPMLSNTPAAVARRVDQPSARRPATRAASTSRESALATTRMTSALLLARSGAQHSSTRPTKSPRETLSRTSRAPCTAVASRSSSTS